MTTSTDSPYLAAAIQTVVPALQRVGFTGTALTTFTAIALAESGGDPSVLNNNPSTGDYSCGLFQINYYGGLYQSRTQMFGPPPQNAPRGVSHQPTQSGIMNPVNNAQAAYALSNGGGNTSPWISDWEDGGYYRMLPIAQEAVASVGTTAPGTYSSSVEPTPTTGSASNATLTAYTGDAGHKPVLQIHTGWAQNIPGVPGTVTLLNQGQVNELLGIGCLLAGGIIGMIGILVLVKGSIKPSIPNFNGQSAQAPTQTKSMWRPMTGPPGVPNVATRQVPSA